MDSVGCGPSFRFMWAAIPLDVGQHYGDVGRCFGDVGQPKAAPRVKASEARWMGVQPLLLHARDLRAKRFPVAFRYRRLAHFLDDVGEVLQAGDRGSASGIEHGDILAGTSKQDGSSDLFHGDASSVHAERQLFIGG